MKEAYPSKRIWNIGFGILFTFIGLVTVSSVVMAVLQTKGIM